MPNASSRTGYVLVECLVALVLLAGGAALLQLVEITSAASLDRAVQRDAALMAHDVARNRWLRDVCLPSASAPDGWQIPLGPRLTRSIEPASAGGLHLITVRSAWNEGVLALVGAERAAGSRRTWTHVTSSGIRCD